MGIVGTPSSIYMCVIFIPYLASPLLMIYTLIAIAGSFANFRLFSTAVHISDDEDLGPPVLSSTPVMQNNPHSSSSGK